MNDETIGSVVGGVNEDTAPEQDGNENNIDKIVKTITVEPVVDRKDICKEVFEFFGFDSSQCDD